MADEYARHARYMEAELEKRKGKAELRDLVLYHEARMHDFQHERLIHFLVTMLVALVTILLVCVSVVLGQVLFLPVVGILLILLFAYLLHYRKLENGVQSLYSLSEKAGRRLLDQDND